MPKQSAIVLSSAVLAGSLVLLSGCFDRPAGAPAASPASVQPAAGNSSAPSKGKEAIAGLALDAKELVLAPGAAKAISVYAVGANQTKTDITGKSGLEFRSSKPDVVTAEGGTLKASPGAATGSAAVVTASYQGQTAELTVTVKASLEDTIAVINGKPTVSNANDIAVVVNKKRALPDNYTPSDLIEPKVPFSFNEKNEKRKLRAPAAEALEKLFAAAAKDGVKLAGVSGFRSYATQKAIYASNVKTQGEQEASRVSAQPGQSEHQTGLAIDVSSASAGYALEETFGETKEGKWLAAHAHEFGFIIRYPKGKEAITGYAYEPWHIRYVGAAIAKDIYERGITLEEYFEDAVSVSKTR